MATTTAKKATKKRKRVSHKMYMSRETGQEVVILSATSAKELQDKINALYAEHTRRPAKDREESGVFIDTLQTAFSAPREVFAAAFVKVYWTRVAVDARSARRR